MLDRIRHSSVHLFFTVFRCSRHAIIVFFAAFFRNRYPDRCWTLLKVALGLFRPGIKCLSVGPAKGKILGLMILSFASSHVLLSVSSWMTFRRSWVALSFSFTCGLRRCPWFYYYYSLDNNGGHLKSHQPWLTFCSLSASVWSVGRTGANVDCRSRFFFFFISLPGIPFTLRSFPFPSDKTENKFMLTMRVSISVFVIKTENSFFFPRL